MASSASKYGEGTEELGMAEADTDQGRGRQESSHGRRGNTNLLDRFPNQRRDEGVPSGGLPRKGRDTDGDEGSFMASACPGHHDHLGGGKPPTSKVLTMQHDGPVAFPLPPLGRELHPIGVWFPSSSCGCVCPTPLVLLCLPMLYHPMGFQRPCRHPLPAVPALDPLF